MGTAAVHVPSDSVHDAAEPHPGPWTDSVYVVLSDRGVHWIGAHRAAALLMKLSVAGSRVVTMETGTAYLQGR